MTHEKIVDVFESF